uniref:Uncharacterized protein n=1 Tax=Moniliophthora roreri TaxID=221103 RepID=A0A0W0FFL6_MONRR
MPDTYSRQISAGEGADPSSLHAKDGNKPTEKHSANHCSPPEEYIWF